MTESVEVALAELKVMMVQQNQTLAEIRSDVKAQNGRVGALERITSEQQVKITNLDREVFGRRHSDPEAAVKLRRMIAGRAITDRDVQIVYLTLGVVIAVIEGWFRFVSPLIHGKP